MLNAWPQFTTDLDGPGQAPAVPIHFVHVRSPHPNAFPIVLTHGELLLGQDVTIESAGNKGLPHKPVTISGGDTSRVFEVAANAHVLPRVEAGASLADENRSAGYELSGEALHTEHFRLRVAAVTR